MRCGSKSNSKRPPTSLQRSAAKRRPAPSIAQSAARSLPSEFVSHAGGLSFMRGSFRSGGDFPAGHLLQIGQGRLRVKVEQACVDFPRTSIDGDEVPFVKPVTANLATSPIVDNIQFAAFVD